MTVNLWNDAEAPLDDLALRVYTSRLLGRDKSLVLHGGGNTSVKIRETNLVGEEEDILYVKGSGWDLETIEAGGFAPVRLAHCLKLAELDALSDPQMVNELRTHMTQASAPTPSVEAILHALIPHKYVDHTHADAIVSITNTEDGAARIREIYGDKVVVVPYVMPGFDLARICALGLPRQMHAGTIGMVLMNHGIFSFGDTAKESYDRMIELVTMAEGYLKARGAWEGEPPSLTPDSEPWRFDLAALRREISATAAGPMLVSTHANAKTLAFARRPDIAPISQQGTATPDHVIRTKRLPMLGRTPEALADYAGAYRAYFVEGAKKAAATGTLRTLLDPAPRVILDPQWGLATVGRSAADADIVAELYDHTIDIIGRATKLGGFRTLAPRELFEVEYWDLEQAKLKKSGKPSMFAGEIALVTGAFSGIGRACVESLLARGAAVIGLDIAPAVETEFPRPDFLGVTCDVADPAQIVAAIEKGVRRFGGLDMLILNAGVFPGGCRIESLADAEWRRVMAINLDANLAFLRECHPLLKFAPRRGRVVVIGSKNVPAPGPGAAAYSASKAAVNQLARVAALEWGADGIRINSLHPNAVFDTALWTPEVLESRAKHYGLTVEQYKTHNVLKVEVTSRDVAELAAEMCGPLFAKTTAAQVPVDGGNERVI
ncbi:MAG: bifunctional aldolase/short-chain dehydrogenase [Rhodocyclaceae bacterium]|nr:bifunctional aldolase/short-chain dehydrogenase [Rhodocyclaceae bacterium]